jgi:hypothetical protein
MPHEQIFLLSPASCSGKRAELLLREQAQFDLAVRLRSEGAELGEVFCFLSGLYFRGKLAYSTRFASPENAGHGSWVITAGRGLLRSDTVVRLADLRAFAEVPIDLAEPRYLQPLMRDALALADSLHDTGRAILLGSVATDKYVQVLEAAFGERLMFPREFVGRGDMSRGGLMLRHCDQNRELDYIPLAGAVRRGSRPAKLGKRPPRHQPEAQAKETPA